MADDKGAQCGPCGRRRKMAADAYRRDGLPGVVKALPAIVRDTIRNPPNIRTPDWKRKWPK